MLEPQDLESADFSLIEQSEDYPGHLLTQNQEEGEKILVVKANNPHIPLYTEKESRFGKMRAQDSVGNKI
jgi:hypothetical protein